MNGIIVEAIDVDGVNRLSPNRHCKGVIGVAHKSLHSPRLPRGSNKGQKSVCHPERPAWCKRLCQSCYVAGRRALKERRADCHPSRPHVAHGLCRNCYRAKLRDNEPLEKRQARWRRASLKYNFGITIEQFDAMLAEQGGRCAMCSAEFSTGQWKTFAVDHDHATSRVRGLLCFRCNIALGYYEKYGAMCIAYLSERQS